MLSILFHNNNSVSEVSATDLSKVKPWQKVAFIADARIGDRGIIETLDGVSMKTSKIEGIVETEVYYAIETRNSVYYISRVDNRTK